MKHKSAAIESSGNPVIDFHGEVRLVGRKPIVITNELGTITIRRERRRLKDWIRALFTTGILLILLAGCYAQSASTKHIAIEASGAWRLTGTVNGDTFFSIDSGNTVIDLADDVTRGDLAVVSTSPGNPSVTATLYVQHGYVHAVLGSVTFDPTSRTTIATATAGALSAHLVW